jgi:hypothetical protein
MTNENLRAVWTVTAEYGATGEGETMMACLAWAETAAEAKGAFLKAFGPFFALACKAERGVIKNSITEQLFSDKALDRLRAVEQRRGMLEATSSIHFNFA